MANAVLLFSRGALPGAPAMVRSVTRADPVAGVVGRASRWAGAGWLLFALGVAVYRKLASQQHIPETEKFSPAKESAALPWA